MISCVSLENSCVCPHGRLRKDGFNIVLWHDVEISSWKATIKNFSLKKDEQVLFYKF